MRIRLRASVLAWILTAAAIPYSGAAESGDSSGFRLLSYNVWYGFTEKPERKGSALDWLGNQEPDLVALQELNGYDRKMLKEDASRWGHRHVALLKEDGFPTGLTSNRPLRHVRRIRDGFHHGLLTARVGDVQVYVLHLHPSDWEQREREIDRVLADVREVRREVSETVLIGDFNTFSRLDEAHYERDLIDFFAERDRKHGEKNLKQGRLQYSVLEAAYQAGFTDLVARFRQRDDSFGSFPTLLRADENHGPVRRLDYILATPGLAKGCVAAGVVDTALTQKLSDHLPVVADFAEWPKAP